MFGFYKKLKNVSCEYDRVNGFCKKEFIHFLPLKMENIWKLKKKKMKPPVICRKNERMASSFQ